MRYPRFFLTADDGDVLDPPQVFRVAAHPVPTLRFMAEQIQGYVEESNRLRSVAQNDDFVATEVIASELRRATRRQGRVVSDQLPPNIFNYHDMGLSYHNLISRPVGLADRLWLLCSGFPLPVETFEDVVMWASGVGFADQQLPNGVRILATGVLVPHLVLHLGFQDLSEVVEVAAKVDEMAMKELRGE